MVRRFVAAAVAVTVLALVLPGGAGIGTQAAPRARALEEPVFVAGIGDVWSPTTITVPAGTTVVWVNQESDPQDSHNVNSYARLFSSPDFYPGDSFSLTFDTPGEYRYYCAYHDGMEGTVVVE